MIFMMSMPFPTRYVAYKAELKGSLGFYSSEALSLSAVLDRSQPIDEHQTSERERIREKTSGHTDQARPIGN